MCTIRSDIRWIVLKYNNYQISSRNPHTHFHRRVHNFDHSDVVLLRGMRPTCWFMDDTSKQLKFGLAIRSKSVSILFLKSVGSHLTLLRGNLILFALRCGLGHDVLKDHAHGEVHNNGLVSFFDLRLLQRHPRRIDENGLLSSFERVLGRREVQVIRLTILR